MISLGQDYKRDFYGLIGVVVGDQEQQDQVGRGREDEVEGGNAGKDS